jgi:hypothetical protein
MLPRRGGYAELNSRGADTVIRVKAGVVRTHRREAASRICGTWHSSARHPSERWGPAADIATVTVALDSSVRWNDGRSRGDHADIAPAPPYSRTASTASSIRSTAIVSIPGIGVFG